MTLACVDSSVFAVDNAQVEDSQNQTVVTDTNEVNPTDETDMIDSTKNPSETQPEIPVEETTEPVQETVDSIKTDVVQDENVENTQQTQDQQEAKASIMGVEESAVISPIQASINAAVTGTQTTVSINENTVIDTSLIIPAQKNIILNLNTFQMETSGEFPLIVVEENATLTIQGSGILLNRFDNGVVIENNGTLVLKGGTLNASGNSGMVVSKTVDNKKVEGTYSLTSGSVVASVTGEPVKSLKVVVLQTPSKVAPSNVDYQSLKLSWSTTEGAKAYEVYRSTNKDSGFSKIGITSNNYYVSGNLTTGTTYYYKLKSVSDNTASSYSATVSSVAKPASTSKITASSVNYDTSKITWAAVSGATTYRIYRSTQPTTGYKKITTVTNTTQYVDKGLQNGTKYYYKVRAYAAKIAGAYSTTASVKPVIKKTSKVTAKSVSASAVNVSWKKVTGASKYVIYQSTKKSSGYKKVATVSSKKLSYKATKLTTGVHYFYKVYALKNGIKGKASTAVYAAPKPNKVTQISVVSGGDMKAVLSWAKPAGASAYRIYRSTTKSSGYKRIATVSTTTFTDTAVANGTTYYYRIASVAGVAKSKFSSSAVFTNATSVAISKASLSLQVGKSKTLKATVSPSTTTTQTIKWSSSNKSVATVTSKGKVKTIAQGSAVITAKTKNGLIAQCTVTVNKGIVVVLDPGHGGYDGGAYYNGVAEKTLNLKVSKYTKAELETYKGVEVYMTRTSDTYPTLAERTEFAESKGATCFIAQHFNASTSHAGKGVGAFITLQSAYNAESKALARKIMSQLESDIGISEWGVYTRASSSYPGQDYYGVIRGSVAKGFPGIIIENAFMDSSDYSNYINSDAKLKKIGVSNAKAIAAYYGLSK